MHAMSVGIHSYNAPRSQEISTALKLHLAHSPRSHRHCGAAKKPTTWAVFCLANAPVLSPVTYTGCDRRVQSDNGLS